MYLVEAKYLAAAPARRRRLVPQAHARRGGTDFSVETTAVALQGSGYSAALIAELLLKAAGHYDVILAEAAAAGPLD